VNNPNPGFENSIKLMGRSWRYIPGTYECSEPPRFGEKLSIGPLKYTDFAPFESAFSWSSGHGGCGVRRFSDIEGHSGFPAPEYPMQIPPVYLETSNVDLSEAGIGYLSPKQYDEPLEGSTTPVTWIGEFKGVLYCVAGTKVYYREATGGWTLKCTLDKPALKGAVGVFGDYFIVGYGAEKIAQYTSNFIVFANLTNESGDLYVWAFTADRAAAYVAGGLTVNSYNDVVSSIDGKTYAGTPVVCGAPHTRITSLCPGGDQAILYIGKDSEFGEIDFDGEYHLLIPFDTQLSDNAENCHWWMGSGGNEQRGPLVVFFNRDYGIWNYKPGGGYGSGTVENWTPWSQPYCRPIRARGSVTALQGSARWFYFAVLNRYGDTIVYKRDGRSGTPHTWLDLGSNECRAMCISGLFEIEGTHQPMLFMGKGNNVCYVKLPVDGGSPLDDPNCDFCSEGYILYPAIDYNFPDEDKVAFSATSVADALMPGQQYIEMQAAFEGSGTYQDLGTASASPSSSIDFSTATVVKSIELKLKLVTELDTVTPQLRGLVVRGSLNTKLYRVWTMQLQLPQGSTSRKTADLRGAFGTVDALWTAKGLGIPVAFTDIWGQEWRVRILQLKEVEVFRENGKEPEMVLSVVLLERFRGAGNGVWDDPMFIWDSPTSIWE
jgi:hypothetical protein